MAAGNCSTKTRDIDLLLNRSLLLARPQGGEDQHRPVRLARSGSPL